MKLHFFGANRTTTGSKHLLEVKGQRVLIECGMFQGRRSKTIEYNSQLPFAATGITTVLLSHAHIDHSGLLPVLCQQGYAGKIHATAATTDLCQYMLLDSAHIQEQDAAFLNQKLARKGLPLVKPLYTQADATKALEQFAPVSYDQPVRIADGVTVTWLDAGHILGSAMLVLDLEENGRRVRLAFSGDIGRGNNNMLRDPAHPRDVDYLLMESTYGNRAHESLDDVDERVCAMINRAVADNGKIIIPAFAVDRTQQLLFTLFRLMQTRCLPAVPIYVDSPLSRNATDVFRRHPECFNKHFHDVMMSPENPFANANITFTGSVEESKQLNDLTGPCIIISASGMAEAGRIRHHIKNNITDKRNLILMVGWCAPHTLGSHLATGHKEVNIFGEPYQVKARIETINAYSGHADQHELRSWAGQVTGSVRGIFLVHGELEAAEALAGSLRELHPRAEISVPEFGSSAEL